MMYENLRVNVYPKVIQRTFKQVDKQSGDNAA